ncbi:GDP-mannose 6-dehydrogenase [soil metagenome]
MNISVFGLGYVGCVSLGCLAQCGHKVIGVDPNETKVKQINSGRSTIVEKDIDKIIKDSFDKGRIEATLDYEYAVKNSEISIICVGTPSSSTGHLNFEYILGVSAEIGSAIRNKKEHHIIVIRSTVMPGTCSKVSDKIKEVSGNDNFTVISNPEFLREGTAVNDFYNPPLILIGCENKSAAEKYISIYSEVKSKVIITETRVAEIMKYINNTYHALKISFANEVGNICEKLDIDSHKVMEIFCEDKQLNISPYYFKPGFAYGGSCLPKDLKAFQRLSQDLYLDSPVIQSIDKSNDNQVKKAVELITSNHGKNIGFLGLSFKEGTDDLRNSPSVTVIETLLGKGFYIKIYDKNVQLSHLTGTNKSYIEDHIPHLSNLLTNDIEDVIGFSDILVVATKEEEFRQKLIEVKDKIIVDLVRINDKLLNQGNYFGIAW